MKLLSMRVLFFTLSSFSSLSYSMTYSLSAPTSAYQQIYQVVQTALQNKSFSLFSPAFENLPENMRPIASLLYQNNNNINAALLSVLIKEKYVVPANHNFFTPLKNFLIQNGAQYSYAKAVYDQFVYEGPRPLFPPEQDRATFCDKINASLICAIKNHDNKLLNVLHDANVHRFDHDTATLYFPNRTTSLLIYAIENNNNEIAQMILGDPGYTTAINYRDTNDHTAFFTALIYKNHFILELILKHPYFDSRSLLLDQVLMKAIFNHDIPAVKLLLQHPDTPLSTNFYNESALKYAIRRNDKESVFVLLQHPRVTENLDATDLLNFAQHFKNNEIIDLITKHIEEHNHHPQQPLR